MLDEKVNNERTDFSIPREIAPAADCIEASAINPEGAPGDLFAAEISLKAIREGALAAICEDLGPFLDEINSQKEAALTSYIAEDGPQYRVLMKYKGELIDDIPPQASKTELEIALHRQLYQRRVRLKQEGARILSEPASADNAQEYYARLQKFVENENEIGKTSLAQYIITAVSSSNCSKSTCRKTLRLATTGSRRPSTLGFPDASDLGRCAVRAAKPLDHDSG